MKTLYKIPLFLIGLLAFSTFHAQAQTETDTTLIVNGVCHMCKMTIENAAEIKGVSQVEWDVDSKVLALVYNPEITSLEAISQAINNSGYDTEIDTAPEEAYQSLHKCCHYRDPEVVKEHQ